MWAIQADNRRISQSTRDDVVERQRGLCNVCGKALKSHLFDIDHIIPWALVRHNRTDNLQALCLDDHRTKTTADNKLIAFMKTLRASERYCWTCKTVYSMYFEEAHMHAS